MKIGGMDATSTLITPVNNDTGASSKQINQNSDAKKVELDEIENKNVSQITDNDKKELPVSEKYLIDAIEKANKAITGSNREFEIAVHEKTKDIMVKVIDKDTKQVIREFPPKKIMDLIAKIWEMAGIMVDERR